MLLLYVTDMSGRVVSVEELADPWPLQSTTPAHCVTSWTHLAGSSDIVLTLVAEERCTEAARRAACSERLRNAPS